MDEIKKEEEKQGGNGGRKKIAAAIFVTLGIVGAVVIFLYLRYKSTHIATDDAFIEAHIHTVASKVPGTVRRVLVDTNQLIRKGDLLVKIDDADLAAGLDEAASRLNADRARLSEATVGVDVAGRRLSELRYHVEAARANLDLQEAGLRQAELDLERAKNLLQKGVIPKERFEKTRTAHDIAAAQVKAARDQVKQAESAEVTQQAVIRQSESALRSQSSVIKQREAGLKAADLQKSYTRIVAPADGYVTKKSVEPGNQVQPGQPLMAVVPLEDVWVTANYKETQLGKVKPGMKVEIKVDTYPGRKFRGKVDSIMAGTGSAFSLFPAENATGNFVKIVQRIPVKIVLDRDADPEHLLRVGMSVEPTIVLQ